MPEMTDAEWLREVSTTLGDDCCNRDGMGCGERRMLGIADRLDSLRDHGEAAPVAFEARAADGHRVGVVADEAGARSWAGEDGTVIPLYARPSHEG